MGVCLRRWSALGDIGDAVTQKSRGYIKALSSSEVPAMVVGRRKFDRGCEMKLSVALSPIKFRMERRTIKAGERAPIR